MTQAMKIEWCEAVRGYVEMPVSYDASRVTVDDLAHDTMLTRVAEDDVHSYAIITDDGTSYCTARDIDEAARMFAPGTVAEGAESAEALAQRIVEVGGYITIREDDLIVLRAGR